MNEQASRITDPIPTPRWLHYALIFSLIVIVALFLFAFGQFLGWPFVARWSANWVVSPDGSKSAAFVKRSQFIDTNFALLLNSDGRQKSLFWSPDELPTTQSWLWWSPDSRFILVGGTKFRVADEGNCGGGFQVYILCDTQTGEIRCNSKDVSELPKFDCEQLSHLGFPIRRIATSDDDFE